MRIAIVGAGCLGSVYAARLASHAEVALVSRDRALAPTAVRLESGGVREVPRSLLADSVPADAEVIVIAVRSDQVEQMLPQLSVAPDALVVSLTPLLPPTAGRVRATLGDRYVAAMPGVVGRHVGREIAYYAPASLPTRLGAPPPPFAELAARFGATLAAAGSPTAAPSAEVPAMVAATVIALLPMLLGVPAAGSIDALLADDPLLRLSVEAGRETLAIARRVGTLPTFAGMFLSFASPFTIRAGVRLGRARAPASIDILEGHFGRRLAPQNAALVADTLTVAAGLPVSDLRALAARAASPR